MRWIQRMLSRFQQSKPEEAKELCLQCGFPPGKEMRVVSDDPFLHPHRCSWCGSVVYMPGLMIDCDACNDGKRHAA
jgi:hypothetical protein